MLPLGTIAPSFSLLEVSSGKKMALADLKGEKGTLVMFICNHCPYVIHLNSKLVEVANHFQPQGIAFIAISSNDVVNYPDDSPEKMKEVAKREKYPFPYLYDQTQEVAKAYQAACTPDFFLFDRHLACFYRGQFDASRPRNQEPVTGKDLKNAISLLLAGQASPEIQVPSIGCNIKWKLNWFTLP